MTDFEDEEFDLDSDEAEYLEMIESWEDDEDDGNDSIPELYFSRPDPYANHDPLPDDQRRRNYHIDEQGRIVVRNPSAWHNTDSLLWLLLIQFFRFLRVVTKHLAESC